MKKLWSFLLCAALLCALCACGGQTSQTEDAPAPADAGEPAGRSAPAEAAPYHLFPEYRAVPNKDFS